MNRTEHVQTFSETRIRPVGMGLALLVNQGVFSGTAAFFPPGTKSGTLEEIEVHFGGGELPN